MVRVTNRMVGILNMTIYTFSAVGDTVPMHAHPEGECHISIVAKGIIKMHGREWAEDCGPGTMKQFMPNKLHEFVAVEVPAKLIGIRY